MYMQNFTSLTRKTSKYEFTNRTFIYEEIRISRAHKFYKFNKTIFHVQARFFCQ